MKRSHAAALAALTLLVLLRGTVLTARAQQGAPPPRGSFRPLYGDAAPVSPAASRVVSRGVRARAFPVLNGGSM